MADEPSDRYVELSIQKTWAARGASAEVLKSPIPLIQPKAVGLTLGSLVARLDPHISEELQRLIASGEDLAAGRDKEGVKQLTWRSGSNW